MAKLSDGAILGLVELLYSCADGTSAWPTFLGELSRAVHASVIGISTNSLLQAAVGLGQSELVSYQNHFVRINPWLTGPKVYPQGKILLAEEVLDFDSYCRTPFYNEWGKRNKVAHAVGGAIRAGCGSIIFLSVNRGNTQQPFGEQERSLITLLMPHLQRAVHVYERLSILQDQSAALFAFNYPVLFSSPEGFVRWANHAAERLLQRGRGLRFVNGRIAAELPDETAILHKKLREATVIVDETVTGHGGWLRLTSSRDESGLLLLLTRPPELIRRQLGFADASQGFLVFVASQIIEVNMLCDRIRRLWGLTVAEAALAAQILESDGLTLAAEKLRISRNTAKTQLAAIFQKSGCRRQTELVRKLLELAVFVSPSSE